LTENEFALGHIAKCGAENDDDAGQTSKPNEGETDVRTREDGPSFHLFFVTVVIVACCGGFGKGGLPAVLFEVGNHFLKQLNVISYLPENHITVSAQQFPNFTRVVAVVHTQFLPPAIALLSTDSAQTLLLTIHISVVLGGNPVVSHQVVVSCPFRVVLMSLFHPLPVTSFAG
jgi:hypothetical protein